MGIECQEKYIQIPLPEDYIERLNKRAVEYDRVMSREGARILKDVLDGRYEPVLPGLERRGAEADGLKAVAPIQEGAAA